MNERVILAVKFTPAGASGQVRKAVGGFLRYVQHRDLHPTQPEGRPRQEVSGLVKYVAYRDRASLRAELFGPAGTLDSTDRKAFAAFVAGALESSSPQLYRGRDGQLHDRRRAVYRMVISPERAQDLDLRRLTLAAVERLQGASGAQGLRWLAAIHRNTAHHHVHLVLAGMREDGVGGFARLDLTKPRLAAMKEALMVEIERQRNERAPSRRPVRLAGPPTQTGVPGGSFEASPMNPVRSGVPLRVSPRPSSRRPILRPTSHSSVITLRGVARRYQRRMEGELEQEYRRSQWERAA